MSYRWLEDRRASAATLQGTYCRVVAAGTLAALWPRFVYGIEFTSRHGDDLRLWAIFERPSADLDISPQLTQIRPFDLVPETPELVAAFAALDLTWTS